MKIEVFTDLDIRGPGLVFITSELFLVYNGMKINYDTIRSYLVGGPGSWRWRTQIEEKIAKHNEKLSRALMLPTLLRIPVELRYGKYAKKAGITVYPDVLTVEIPLKEEEKEKIVGTLRSLLKENRRNGSFVDADADAEVFEGGEK